MPIFKEIHDSKKFRFLALDRVQAIQHPPSFACGAREVFDVKEDPSEMENLLLLTQLATAVFTRARQPPPRRFFFRCSDQFLEGVRNSIRVADVSDPVVCAAANLILGAVEMHANPSIVSLAYLCQDVSDFIQNQAQAQYRCLDTMCEMVKLLDQVHPRSGTIPHREAAKVVFRTTKMAADTFFMLASEKKATAQSLSEESQDDADLRSHFSHAHGILIQIENAHEAFNAPWEPEDQAPTPGFRANAKCQRFNATTLSSFFATAVETFSHSLSNPLREKVRAIDMHIASLQQGGSAPALDDQGEEKKEGLLFAKKSPQDLLSPHFLQSILKDILTFTAALDTTFTFTEESKSAPEGSDIEKIDQIFQNIARLIQETQGQPLENSQALIQKSLQVTEYTLDRLKCISAIAYSIASGLPDMIGDQTATNIVAHIKKVMETHTRVYSCIAKVVEAVQSIFST